MVKTLLIALVVMGQVPNPPSSVQQHAEIVPYGFVEADTILDSTQGLNDLAGNAALAKPRTYAGEHRQLTFGLRNSRLGLKLKAPQLGETRLSAQIETDFLGNQAGTTESAVFSTPVLRLRHAFVRMESPWVDVLIGQYWELFGWQGNYHPNTVAIQGVPGQVYSRTPQFRVSHTFAGEDVSLQVAAAALRPLQRAAATPDGQAGLRLMLNGLKAAHTAGATASSIDPLSVAVSGTLRRFEVDEFSSSPNTQRGATGWGVSADALVPIVPPRDGKMTNTLTLVGSFVTGRGISDQYTGLTGGVSNPSLPNPGHASPAPTYVPNIDPGLAIYDAQGNLHAVQWTSALAGVQYYTPFDGIWLSANCSWMHSDDSATNGASNAMKRSRWADANLFYDAQIFDGTPAVRLGLEGALFDQTSGTGVDAKNWRGQFSAFYIF